MPDVDDASRLLDRSVRIDGLRVGSVGAVLTHGGEIVGIELDATGRRFFVPWSAVRTIESRAVSVESALSVLDESVFGFYRGRCTRVARR